MPSAIEIRDARHRAILTILRRARVRSQEELVAQLVDRGIAATQSSVSRDLRDLGVVKRGGRYQAPPLRTTNPGGELAEAARFLRRVSVAGPHVTVVLTTVGAAQTVGLALDRAAWPEVVGTLAGDDTVFVATANGQDQKALLRRLELLAPGGER